MALGPAYANAAWRCVPVALEEQHRSKRFSVAALLENAPAAAAGPRRERNRAIRGSEIQANGLVALIGILHRVQTFNLSSGLE